MVDARLQLAPGEVADVAQVHAFLVVGEQVHALVRPQLLGHVLQTELGFHQVGAATERQAQRVVARVVSGRADFVGRQGVARAAGESGGRSRDEEPVLEVAAGVVVVRFRNGAGIRNVEALGRVGRRRVAAADVAVAAVEGTDFTLDEACLTRCREFRLGGLGDDRATDAVAADADRRDAGVDLDRTHLRGIEIRQRGVHVVGAGGQQVHAVDLDAQAVVGEAVDRGQAGHAAGTVEADTGHVAQQAGGVAGGGAGRRQVGRIEPRTRARRGGVARGADGHFRQGGGVGGVHLSGHRSEGGQGECHREGDGSGRERHGMSSVGCWKSCFPQGGYPAWGKAVSRVLVHEASTRKPLAAWPAAQRWHPGVPRRGRRNQWPDANPERAARRCDMMSHRRRSRAGSGFQRRQVCSACRQKSTLLCLAE